MRTDIIIKGLRVTNETLMGDYSSATVERCSTPNPNIPNSIPVFNFTKIKIPAINGTIVGKGLIKYFLETPVLENITHIKFIMQINKSKLKESKEEQIKKYPDPLSDYTYTHTGVVLGTGDSMVSIPDVVWIDSNGEITPSTKLEENPAQQKLQFDTKDSLYYIISIPLRGFNIVNLLSVLANIGAKHKKENYIYDWLLFFQENLLLKIYEKQKTKSKVKQSRRNIRDPRTIAPNQRRNPIEEMVQGPGNFIPAEFARFQNTAPDPTTMNTREQAIDTRAQAIADEIMQTIVRERNRW